MMAEGRTLTENLDLGRTGHTWRRVRAAEVSAKPSFVSEAIKEVTFRAPSKPFSATESKPEAVPNGEGIPFDLKLNARRPLLFEEDQSPEQRERFLVLQDWEGVVETIGSETFAARLRDRSSDETYAGETAELPIADVSDDDRELLRPGAVFYLTVGRLVRASGRQERVGRVVFRRLPAWTESTLSRANQRAERLSRFLSTQN